MAIRTLSSFAGLKIVIVFDPSDLFVLLSVLLFRSRYSDQAAGGQNREKEEDLTSESWGRGDCSPQFVALVSMIQHGAYEHHG